MFNNKRVKELEKRVDSLQTALDRVSQDRDATKLELQAKIRSLEKEVLGLIDENTVLRLRGVLPDCDKCHKPMRQLGALVFGPPDSSGKCSKQHVCVKCKGYLEDWFSYLDSTIEEIPSRTTEE